MDKEKPQSHGGGFLHQSSRYSGFSSAESSFDGKSEATSSSISFPLLAPSTNSDWGQSDRGLSIDSTRFSHDISRMPKNPQRNVSHRRAHSEILTLPDYICFDSDLGIIGGAYVPSLSDDTEEDLLSMYLDMDKFNSSIATSANQVGDSSSSLVEAATATSTEDIVVGLKERPKVRHQQQLKSAIFKKWKERRKFRKRLVAAKTKLSEMEQKHVLDGFKFGEKAKGKLHPLSFLLG
ncbi:hypothetical protein IC582_019034 [Cucumis melo]